MYRFFITVIYFFDIFVWLSTVVALNLDRVTFIYFHIKNFCSILEKIIYKYCSLCTCTNYIQIKSRSLCTSNQLIKFLSYDVISGHTHSLPIVHGKSHLIPIVAESTPTQDQSWSIKIFVKNFQIYNHVCQTCGQYHKQMNLCFWIYLLVWQVSIIVQYYQSRWFLVFYCLKLTLKFP